MDAESVATPTAAYLNSAERWELPDALMGGTQAMRSKGRGFLPQEPAESDKRYESRLSRSFLYNGLRRAVRNLTGRVFARAVQLGSDVPPQLVALAEDVDLQGNHLNVFARELFRNALVRGLSHVLVEMPPAILGGTLDDERKAGLRPYLVHVDATRIIGWRHQIIAGRVRLTQLRISQTIARDAGQFGTQDVQQVRVLTPGAWQVWERDAKGDWIAVSDGVTSLDYIPLFTLYAERTGVLTGECPLEDLAWLNLQHWQSASDQRNILHVARVPLLFGKGLGDGEIVVSADSLIKGPPESDLKFVEHSGAAIGAGAEDLAKIEERMSLLALEALMPRVGQQTATARAIDSIESASELQMWAVAMADCLENALKGMADYLGLPDGGSVVVNTDLALNLRDASDVQSLIAARNTGQISRETLWAELKRRNVLMDSFDPDIESDRLADEPPTGRTPNPQNP